MSISDREGYQQTTTGNTSSIPNHTENDDDSVVLFVSETEEGSPDKELDIPTISCTPSVQDPSKLDSIHQENYDDSVVLLASPTEEGSPGAALDSPISSDTPSSPELKVTPSEPYVPTVPVTEDKSLTTIQNRPVINSMWNGRQYRIPVPIAPQPRRKCCTLELSVKAIILILEILMVFSWFFQPSDSNHHWFVNPLLLAVAVVSGTIGVIARQHIAITLCAAVVLAETITFIVMATDLWPGVVDFNIICITVMVSLYFEFALVKYAKQLRDERKRRKADNSRMMNQVMVHRHPFQTTPYGK